MTIFASYSTSRAVRTKSIESAIIAAAIGEPIHTPVDLVKIVDQVGAYVRQAPCQNAFTYFQAAGPPIIHLSDSESSGRRQRFIAAHEIAHIILRNPTVLDLIAHRGQSHLLGDEEDLANRVAGALLVPDSWIEDLKHEQVGPSRIWEISSLAGIPISMLVARMEHAGIDVALLHWLRGKGSWYVIDRPGSPPFLHGRVEVSALGRRALDHLVYGMSEVTVDCRASGVWTRISGRTYRARSNSDRILQVLAPRRDISF